MYLDALMFSVKEVLQSQIVHTSIHHITTHRDSKINSTSISSFPSTNYNKLAKYYVSANYAVNLI